MKLRHLQNEYFKYLKSYGDTLGVPIYRGTLVEEQKREYVRETDHEIGQMRTELGSMSNELDILKQKLAIKEKELTKAVTLSELKDIETNQKKKGSNWDKKGVKYNQEIFHGKKKGDEGFNK
jgi:Skp family chaperone for outer membrane proteins